MNGWRCAVTVVDLLSGCGDSEPGGEPSPTLELHEHSRLGTVEGSGGMLTSVAGVLPDDSVVFVLEDNPARLTLFDRSGQWLRDVARQGDGPGELRRPSLLGRTGDQLWVGDPAGGRLEVFTSLGFSTQSYRWDLAPDSLGVRARPTALLADGSVLAGPGSLSIGVAASGRTTHRSYYRASPDGAVLGEIYRESLAASDFFSASISGGGGIVGVHPIRESPLVAVFPDGSGLAVIERPEPDGPQGATYRLLLIGPEGTVEVDQAVPFEPLPTTGWLEREMTKMHEDMVARGGAPNEAVVTALRDAWAPRRYYPPVSRVVAGADGTVWVRREEAASDAVEWQVFDRRGRELGHLTTSTVLTILWASRSQVWGTLTDDMDVPFVVGFDVSRSRAP
jgi:hypothetical protein